MNTDLLCPFCGNRYIIEVHPKFLERFEGSVVTMTPPTLELFVECPCGATFVGELVVA